MADGIALLCMLYPDSPEKQERVRPPRIPHKTPPPTAYLTKTHTPLQCLSLLRHSAREYYPTPKAQCTTWSYFTPLSPPSPKTPSKKPPLVIGGLEIYTTKSALQTQVEDPEFFRPYHETVEREGLYAKPEVLEAWYLDGGFVARESRGARGEGVLISVTRMVCVDREGVFGLMRFVVLFLVLPPSLFVSYLRGC